MKSLTDEFIECNELLNKYNIHFGTEYKSSGVGKLKVIQDNFEKKHKTINGKKINGLSTFQGINHIFLLLTRFV